LSDPLWRAILAGLGDGESSVSQLARPFAMSLIGFSKHLAALESAGLLRRETIGRVVHCRLVAERLRDAARWLVAHAGFRPARLDFADALSCENKQKGEPG
jgi:DNA-binding transcriptional ArsR family regulator